MPSQKVFQAGPTSAERAALIFTLAQDLALDGWGVTVVANDRVLSLQTNAPQNIIAFHVNKRV